MVGFVPWYLCQLLRRESVRSPLSASGNITYLGEPLGRKHYAWDDSGPQLRLTLEASRPQAMN